MGMDLEGEAELNGGFVFRVQGERVRLKLGRYTETFPLENVAALFQRLATEWMADP
jgi:phosphate-selective porin